jgi:hypothetical protein
MDALIVTPASFRSSDSNSDWHAKVSRVRLAHARGRLGGMQIDRHTQIIRFVLQDILLGGLIMFTTSAFTELSIDAPTTWRSETRLSMPKALPVGIIHHKDLKCCKTR